MEIEIGKLNMIGDILSEIAAQDNIDAIDLYNIIKVFKKAEELSVPFKETQKSLGQKYFPGLEKVTNEHENWEDYRKEIDEVSLQKVDFDLKLKLSALKNAKIKGQGMLLLSDIIEEE